jgi:hypothetical protein
MTEPPADRSLSSIRNRVRSIEDQRRVAEYLNALGDQRRAQLLEQLALLDAKLERLWQRMDAIEVRSARLRQTQRRIAELLGSGEDMLPLGPDHTANLNRASEEVERHVREITECRSRIVLLPVLC